MEGQATPEGSLTKLICEEVTTLNKTLRQWLGRSFAIAILIGSGQQAFAHSPHFAPVPETDSTALESPLAMLDSFERITWQLVDYRTTDGSTVAALNEHPATFRFEDGRVTGTTGCNSFFSDYTIEGNQLTINPGGSTLMACLDEAVTAQEAAVLTGLPQVSRYTQTGDQLLLLDSAGTTLFTLTPQPTAALTGTEWALTLYNNGRGGLTTPIIDTAITARFDTEGSLAGSAGCNRYRAMFETSSNSLTIGPAASTRRLCARPEGVMEQESAFLGLLEDVTTYSISGNQLYLKNAEGMTLAQFTAEV